jgi:hypothetical protein
MDQLIWLWGSEKQIAPRLHGDQKKTAVWAVRLGA